MLITKASEYALFSLMYIAKCDKPQDVDKMSEQLGISKSFLAKILQNLAKQKLLISYKGANGGFALARAADEITLLEIINGAEKKSNTVFECSTCDEGCPNGHECGIQPMFAQLQRHVDEFLGSISLSEIMKRSKNEALSPFAHRS